MSGDRYNPAEEIAYIKADYNKRIDVMQHSYNRSQKLLHTQEVKMIKTELLLRHAIAELEAQGTLDFLLIKDPDLRTWWEERQ